MSILSLFTTPKVFQNSPLIHRFSSRSFFLCGVSFSLGFSSKQKDSSSNYLILSSQHLFFLSLLTNSSKCLTCFRKAVNEMYALTESGDDESGKAITISKVCSKTKVEERSRISPFAIKSPFWSLFIVAMPSKHLSLRPTFDIYSPSAMSTRQRECELPCSGSDIASAGCCFGTSGSHKSRWRFRKLLF